MNKTGPKPIESVSMCKFRKEGVQCSRYNRDCYVCGWNPVVEQYRIERIMEGREPYLKINTDVFRRGNRKNYGWKKAMEDA